MVVLVLDYEICGEVQVFTDRADQWFSVLKMHNGYSLHKHEQKRLSEQTEIYGCPGLEIG